MKRYFIDSINENAPAHIPDSPGRYIYLNNLCYLEVTDPTDVFLSFGLTEISLDDISVITNGVFPSKDQIAPPGV